MSETSNSEENKAVENDVPLSSTPSQVKTKNNKVGIAILLLVLIVGITVTSLFLFIGGKKDRSNVSADSGVDEVELYAKNQTGIILESINFEEFDKEEPLAFINLDEIISKSEDLSNNLKYTKSEEVDLAGKTVQSAINVDLKMEGDQPGNLKLDLDLYQTYADDYEGESISSTEMLTILQDAERLEELFENVFITGNIEFNNEESVSFDTDIELTVIDGEAYLKFENIEVDSANDSDADSRAAELEGKVLMVNLDEFFQTIADTYSVSLDTEAFSMLDQYDAILDGGNIEDSQFYKDLNNELKSNLVFVNEETLETLRNVGNPILEVVAEKIDNTEFFVNKDEVDPIRDNSNSVCTSADFSFENTLDAVEEGVIEVIDILMGDKAFANSLNEMKRTQQEFPEEIANVKREIKNSGLAFSLRMCNDKDDNTLTGFGVDLFMETEFDSMDLKMDILNVDLDSDFEIEKPEKVDEDLTDQFNQLFENSMMTVPSLNDSTVPTLDSSDRVMDDYDYSYIDELYEQYMEGEITYEEYMEELSRI